LVLTELRRPYLNKLPSKFEEDDRILITDPMLATGGTIMQV
jgi:uracil phosphoribosyltransferase